MSPDWSATPQAVPYADLRDPQTLNLYSYVRNNPLSKRDPDGHANDDLGTGAAKGFSNEAIDLYNDGVVVVNGIFGTRFHKAAKLKPETEDEVKGMEQGAKMFTAVMFLDGEGEVAEAGEMLSRFGKSRESAARLARKAAEAEEKMGIHGVSTTTGKPAGEVSTAPRSEVEKKFKVHDTPTRNDPNHKTVELPKPVSKQVADFFNNLFGRAN